MLVVYDLLVRLCLVLTDFVQILYRPISKPVRNSKTLNKGVCLSGEYLELYRLFWTLFVYAFRTPIVNIVVYVSILLALDFLLCCN